MPSLRSSPRHRITVQRRHNDPTKLGKNLTPVGSPVTVRCNVHPLTTDETISYGLQTSDSRRVVIHGQAWPGDVLSEITFNGGTWEQAAPVQVFDMSPSTAHSEVIIRKVG